MLEGIFVDFALRGLVLAILCNSLVPVVPVRTHISAKPFCLFSAACSNTKRGGTLSAISVAVTDMSTTNRSQKE